MLLRRIVLLYIVLLLCRIVFYCYNYALIGPLGWQEVLTLACPRFPDSVHWNNVVRSAW